MTTFFLASFNATLRYIVNQRRSIDKIDQWARKTKQTLDDEKTTKKKMLKNKQEEEEITTIEELASELYNKDQLRKEQSNPTYDKFRKTKRPIANMELPPVAKSYNRQSYVHSTPNNNNGSGSGGSNDSKTLSADAHYSKAIRMLSSNFDQLVNGGNALPYPVYYGEYNQEINAKDDNNGDDGGRGDAFVKVDNSKLKRRKKKKKRRKKQQRKNEGGESSSSSWHDKMEQQQQQEEEHSYELIKEYLDNVYERTLDYVYEILGVDFDNDYDKEEGEGGESSSSPSLGGGGDDTATYDEDQFSWSDTKVGSQLIWIYGKLVSLWSRQRTTLKKEVLSSSSTTIPCYIRQQLSRAILLWHLSAMDGNVESAMALGYRHYTRPRGRSTLYSDLVDDKMIAVKW